MSLGIPGKGGGGLINMIAMFAAGMAGTGVWLLLSSALWIICALGCLVLLKIVHSHYLRKGHSFETARTQAKETIAHGIFTRS